MAKTKTIKLRGKKKITYKTIPQLAKILNMTKDKTRALVLLNKKIKKVKKRIKFRGKIVQYKNKKDLSKKLKLDLSTTTQLISDINKDKNTTRYLEINGKIGKYDITQNPTLLKDFGIKAISNKNFISTGYTTSKKINILGSLPTNKKLKSYVVVKFYIPYWDNDKDTGERTTATVDIYQFNPNFDVSSANLEQAIIQRIKDEYLMGNDLPKLPDKRISGWQYDSKRPKKEFFIDDIEYYTKQNGQAFKLVNMQLREEKPLNIDHIFNEIIPNENSENCIYNHLNKIWGKRVKPDLLKSLHTTEDIFQFCESRNIKMIAYGYDCKIVKAYYPVKKSNYKSCCFVAFNNHLYPIENATLKQVHITETDDIKVRSAEFKFKLFLKKGILPADILLDQDEIKIFRVGNKRYFENKDYEICKEILTKFGLLDRLSPLTNLKNISSIIEQLYIKTGINSFMPKANRYIKGGYLYKKEECEITDRYITIDKNKAYACALMKLNRLIKTDIRFNKTYILKDKKDIIDHHLYIVEVVKSSILLPHNSIYTGKYLKYCMKKKLKFRIIEGIETQQEPNYFKQMVKDIYNKCPKHAKFICNVMIGKFANTTELRIGLKCKKLANKDETDCSDGVVIPFNNNYNFICEEKHGYDIYNRKPIHIQILDNARKALYEQLIFLKLKSEDIIQIKTDSITFKDPNTKLITKKLKKIIKDGIEGWKYEKFNEMGCPAVLNKYIGGFGYDEFFTNDNVLCSCYAGAGKTYDILNNIIPKANNYRVLTPSHASLKEYVEANIVCNVIQKYTLNKQIPDEDIIIIDEIGMIDRSGCDLIYKCILEGKQIIAYGDFQQLKPVKSQVSCSDLWLDLAFSRRKQLTTNYRNNFTKEYYDSLINAKGKAGGKYITKQIKKWSVGYKDADVIICYRNKIREYYNMLKCQHLNIPFKLDIYKRDHGYLTDCKISFNLKNLKVGTKIIANTNELSKMGIYNKFTFTIKEVDKKDIVITDGKKDYTIEKKLLNKVVDNKPLFSFAYARTLYSVQGASLDSIHYPEEDYFFLDGRSAYTAISRIKQKIN
mgnify:FL=1|tara:strand:- start:4510 stop:7692 length:3183 start_codon:yes stop_codon:yes gene_type:complete